MSRVILGFVFLAVLGWALPAPAQNATAEPVRTWKDASGQFEIEAAFAGHQEGAVHLKKSDGKVIQVPLDKLHADDRAYVAKLLAPAESPASEPVNPFESAEVIRPATGKDRTPRAAQEHDRKADYSQVIAIVPQPVLDAPFVPDAAPPLELAAVGRAAVLSGPGSAVVAGRDRFFESPRGILVAPAKGEATVVLVNAPPGAERRVRLLRCDLKTMKFAGEVEQPSLSTPIDVSPSGELLACLPDWTARRHGEPEMIEIVRVGDEGLTPVRRWNMGDHAQRDQRFEQLHFIGNDRLLTSSAWGGGIVLWDIDQARAIWQLKLTSHVLPTLSPGRQQIAAMIGEEVGLFNTTTGDTLARFPAEAMQGGVLSFSPDGRRLAWLSQRTIRVWEIATGKLTAEVWFPKQMWAKSLDWTDEGYVLVDRSYLVDLAKRIVLWQYELPRHDAPAVLLGGRLWTLSGGDQPYQLAGLAIPDASAKAKAAALTAEKVLALKPGAAISIKINLPGAKPEELQKVTKALIEEARSCGLVFQANAPITIECSIADGGSETVTYRAFGPRFGPFAQPGDDAKVNKRLSVLSIKENGQELWVASGHYGAPFHVRQQEGQSIQDAVNQQRGNPVQFFLTAKLPKYIARHGADGAYGKSKLSF